MTARVWATSDDGSIEYVSLSSDTLEDGLKVMYNSFFVDEPVCAALELAKNPKAIAELKELCVWTAKDGFSLVAKKKTTEEVVGIALNKLQIKTYDLSKYYKQYIDKCKEPNAKALIEFMDEADKVVDLFDISGAECLLEVMFLATLPDFRKKGIAKMLWKLSLDIGKAAMNGENVKVPIDNDLLPVRPMPTVASAIFTSNVTQTMAKKLGFIKVAEVSYENFKFQGETFASKIGPVPPSITIEYKHL